MDEWISALLIPYLTILAVLVFVLLPPVRKGLYLLPLPSKLQRLNYEPKVHYYVISRQILLFFFPFGVALGIFGFDVVKQQLASLFVLGLSINVAWVAYLSMVTKARLTLTLRLINLKAI